MLQRMLDFYEWSKNSVWFNILFFFLAIAFLFGTFLYRDYQKQQPTVVNPEAEETARYMVIDSRTGREYHYYAEAVENYYQDGTWYLVAYDDLNNPLDGYVFEVSEGLEPIKVENLETGQVTIIQHILNWPDWLPWICYGEDLPTPVGRSCDVPTFEVPSGTIEEENP